MLRRKEKKVNKENQTEERKKKTNIAILGSRDESELEQQDLCDDNELDE